MYKNRDNLFQKLVEQFHNQPEVREITIFGKMAEGTADEYSDLDVQIHTNDARLTQSKYLELIGEISPIGETLLLASDPDIFACSVMLQGYSPYQKIDFGICTGDSPFHPSSTVYKNNNAQGDRTSKLDVIPIIQDVKHNLLNLLFGVPRMTKCFFRKNFEMYRRWQGMINPTLVLLYEKHHGYQKEGYQRELNAVEAKWLFSQLDLDKICILDEILPRDGEVNLMESFLASLELSVSLSREKAGYFDITLNEPFIEDMLTFARAECGKLKSAHLTQ